MTNTEIEDLRRQIADDQRRDDVPWSPKNPLASHAAHRRAVSVNSYWHDRRVFPRLSR